MTGSGGSLQSAGRKEAGRPKPGEIFASVLPWVGGIIGAVAAIFGVVVLVVKSALEALLITLAFSVAILVVIGVVAYRERLLSRRSAMVAAAGVLALAAGVGIGYLAIPSSPVAIPAGPYRAFMNPGTMGVTAVALSPDGKSVVASDINGAAFLWDITSRKFIAGFRSPTGEPVWDVVFGPDGTTIAGCTSTNSGTAPRTSYVNGSVYLWKVASPTKPLATFRDPQGAGIGAIAMSLDGKLLAAADNDGTVYLLDAANLKRTGTTLQSTSFTSGYSITELAFSQDGSELAGADDNGSVYVWSVMHGALLYGPLYNPDTQNPQYTQGIAFSPDAAMVAVTDTNGNTYLWNLSRKRISRVFHDPGDLQMEDVAFTADGRYVITTSHSGNKNASAIRIWNEATGTLVHTFHDPGSNGSTHLALGRDGSILAVADYYHAYLWSLAWLHE